MRNKILLLISFALLALSCTREARRAPIDELGCKQPGQTVGYSAGEAVFEILSSGTWTGSASSVTLTATNTGKIDTITVTYE